MVTKEDCEMIGKDFVPSHDDGKGGHTRAYCRKRKEKLVNHFLEKKPENDSDFVFSM